MAASRREVLKWMACGVGAAAMPFGLPLAARAQAAGGRKLVVIALRGGVDGLHLVPPVGAGVSPAFRADYEAERPTLHFADPYDPAIVRPPERTTIEISGNDYFHLHPQLGFFADIFSTGVHGLRMAVVHGTGGTASRSHFSSLDALEWARPHGAAAGGVGNFNGWLRDTLAVLHPDAAAGLSPLNGAALQTRLPKSFAEVSGDGQRRATPIDRIAGVSLADPVRRPLLDQLYAPSGRHASLAAAGENALSVVDALAGEPAVPGSGPGSFADLYPSGSTGFNLRLHDIARLIDDTGAGAGPPSPTIFTIDYNAGWDTHADQVAELDYSTRIANLNDGLQHFYGELAYRGLVADDVCTLLFTDFGRTVDENSDGGTDHGNGGTMFVIGGGLPSSRVVHSGWDFDVFANNLVRTNGGAPVLDGVGGARTMLATSTDYRSVYRDVLANVLGLSTGDIDDVVLGPSGATVPSAGLWA